MPVTNECLLDDVNDRMDKDGRLSNRIMVVPKEIVGLGVYGDMVIWRYGCKSISVGLHGKETMAGQFRYTGYEAMKHEYDSSLRASN